VAPDIPVPAERALEAAYREALGKLVGRSRGPMADRETKEALAKLGN
jgi:hypothetical protein